MTDECVCASQGFLMLLGTYSDVFETPLTAFTTLFPLRQETATDLGRLSSAPSLPAVPSPRAVWMMEARDMLQGPSPCCPLLCWC